MKNFRVKFKHTLEQFYTAIVEADNENDAEEIVDDVSF